jgi:uncharacterized protein YoxC
MTLRVVLSVAEILLVVGILAFFLNRIAKLLNSISDTLAHITFGVRAVETQCAVIGPAADEINENLTQTVAHLQDATASAKRRAAR